MRATTVVAQVCARRPWITVSVWVLALVLAAAATATLLELTSKTEIASSTESEQGYDVIARHFRPDPSDPLVSEIILIRSSSMTVDAPPFRTKVKALASELRASGATSNVETVFSRGNDRLVSEDRRATVVEVSLRGDCEESADRLIEIVEADRSPFDVSITGECSADRDLNLILADDLKTGELYFGLPAALIVLVLVFGTLVASLVPLLVAIFSIGIAIGLAAVFSQGFDLSVYLFQMTTVMGLAVSTDYGLFIVSRYREERLAGRAKFDAISACAATVNRAVLFSGLAFVLAMSGLLFVPDSTLRSLGVGAITVAFVAILASLTLVPALLGLLGDRINAVRVPLLGRAVDSAGREGRLWSRIARAVMRHPLVSLVASAALLLAAAAPVLDLRLSTPGLRSFPEDAPSREGFAALERDFAVGTVDTAIVVVEGDMSQPRLRAAVGDIAQTLDTNPRFRAPEVEISRDREAARVVAHVAGDSRDEAALEAVEQLREREVPAIFDRLDASVFVTGETAEEIDYTDLMERWLPRIIAFVLLLSVVLLTIAFRSLVLSLKAILLNLLSVGAAYGLMVVVFQHGVGNELFGLRETQVVSTWVPLFLFTVLFGLSMDYHVFLLSRIRESYLETRDNVKAVTRAVATSARVVTGAALIIIVVFAGFARGDLSETQQVGFGVGIALLIDATIIRCVLVPASMKLLGRWNWYLPDWLRWLPDPHVERIARRV